MKQQCLKKIGYKLIVDSSFSEGQRFSEGRDPQEDAGGRQRWRETTELSSELHSEGVDEMNLGWLWVCSRSAHAIFFMFDKKKKRKYLERKRDKSSKSSITVCLKQLRWKII